jgi:predicted dehydrogenase
VAQFGDVIASVVNLKFHHGAIGNIESHAQAVYGYDVRTEIVGSKGSILIGRVNRMAATFMTAEGSTRTLADHFLTVFADAYLAEIQDFVDSILKDQPPRVSGEDGIKALAIAAAAENSYLQQKAAKVSGGHV